MSAPPRVLVLGHRGGRGPGWPAENSCEAYARALAEGADGVELDVRLAGDGEVVCAHDASLGRVTGGRDTRRVRVVPSASLPPLASGERIPTLAEAFEVLRGRFVNVEVKADDAPSVARLARAVARVVEGEGDRTEVLLSSFDPRVVVALAAIAPGLPRGMLVGEGTGPLATALPVALRRLVVAAHVHETLLLPERITALQRAGLRVVAWTVNGEARACELAQAGVHAIITDRPHAIVRALSGRR